MKYFVEFIRTAFEPVGLVGISVCEGNNVDEVLSWAWNAYNRGSGYEVPFAGPSASVDDIFRVRQADGHPGIYELHVVAPVGFKRVDRHAPEAGPRVYAQSIGTWGTLINTRKGEEYGGTIYTVRLDDEGLTPDGLLYCRPTECSIFPKGGR